MFDSVLDRGNVPKNRFGTGAVISIVLHVLLVAAAVWLSTRPPEQKKVDREVTFFAAKPPPPPPPPPPPAPPKKKIEHKVIKKPDAIVQPKEIPKEPPKEEPPPPPDEPEDSSDEGVEGGVEGGVVGGVAGGTIGGQVSNEVLPFGEGMTRPEPLSGEEPRYTREALEAHVQGLMIVKCVITTEGTLQNCHVIKSLPFMEQAVMAALATKRYKPVTFQGRPVAVDYVFNIKLVLPR